MPFQFVCKRDMRGKNHGRVGSGFIYINMRCDRIGIVENEGSTRNLYDLTCVELVGRSLG